MTPVIDHYRNGGSSNPDWIREAIAWETEPEFIAETAEPAELAEAA